MSDFKKVKNDVKELIDPKKPRTVMDILKTGMDDSTFTIDSEELIENKTRKELVDYYESQLSSIHDARTGVVLLDRLFSKLTANMAAKSTVHEIFMNQCFKILMERLETNPGLISSKDLIQLLKVASTESTAGTKELKDIFSSITDIKNWKDDQRSNNSATINPSEQLSEQQKNRVAGAIAEIEASLAQKVRNKKINTLEEIVVKPEK